jgi:hypothetical protein
MSKMEPPPVSELSPPLLDPAAEPEEPLSSTSVVDALVELVVVVPLELVVDAAVSVAAPEDDEPSLDPEATPSSAQPPPSARTIIARLRMATR